MTLFGISNRFFGGKIGVIIADLFYAENTPATPTIGAIDQFLHCFFLFFRPLFLADFRVVSNNDRLLCAFTDESLLLYWYLSPHNVEHLLFLVEIERLQ